MLTYGGSAALSYPVSIYSTWFRRVITYGVPLAFVNYFPALAALGPHRGRGLAARSCRGCRPSSCSAALLAGRRAFARGLRRYESTGS